MNCTNQQFFAAALTAGSIIAGFCGLFLLFRIQREADYYRKPGKKYCEQHFTSSMLLIILATGSSFLFGVWIPIFGLAGLRWSAISPRVIVGGLVCATVLIAAYVFDELVHYRILCPAREPRKTEPSLRLRRIVKLDADFCPEWFVWVPGIVLAAAAGILAFCCVR